MNDKLDDWRKQIDDIDEKIIPYLARRAGIVRKIGKLKKQQNIPTLDKNRWKQILNSGTKRGEILGLSKDFVKDLLNLIHKYSQQIQEKS